MAPPPSSVGAADASNFAALSSAAAPRRAVSVPDTVLKGIGFILGSTLFFCAGDVLAKMAAATLPAVEVTWLRYLTFAMMVVPAALILNGRAAFKTQRPGLQGLRAMAVVCSSVLFVEGLKYLQVAEATAINFVSPIFIMALSIPILGEKVGPYRWAAAAVSFLGVLVVVRPGTSAFQTAALFPLCSAMIWATAAVVTRKMSAERPEVTLAWTAVGGFLVLSLVAPFEWRVPTLAEAGLGILTGVFSTIGHWLLVKGYRLAPASILAPFTYVQLLFATVLGLAAFGVIPSFWTIVGGLVIAASGLYTAHRERVRRAEALRRG